MATLVPLSQLRKLLLGEKVERATATLPQSTTGNLFTISGGRVFVTAIIGEVTVAIQNQLNNTKLSSNPTAGTTQDICAVLDIANDEVGTLYGITGLNSDALIGLSAGALPGMSRRGVVVPVGAIELNCGASNTGSVKWTLFYIPIDDGSSVAAA